MWFACWHYGRCAVAGMGRNAILSRSQRIISIALGETPGNAIACVSIGKNVLSRAARILSGTGTNAAHESKETGKHFLPPRRRANHVGAEMALTQQSQV